MVDELLHKHNGPLRSCLQSLVSAFALAEGCGFACMTVAAPRGFSCGTDNSTVWAVAMVSCMVEGHTGDLRGGAWVAVAAEKCF